MKIGFCQVIAEDDLDSYPFIGFGYLRSYAERHCDVPLEFEYTHDWREISGDCDLVGLSCLSQDYDETVTACDALAARGHTVIVGGVHLSDRPQDLPASARVGVLFEGEATFADLLLACARDRSLFEPTLRRIPGIVFRALDGSLERTPPRPSLDMDQLPIPDRRMLMRPGHALHIFTSRGCIYKCSFCSSTAYWKKFRRFTPEYVAGEIAQLSEAFPEKDRLTLADDLFVADRRRMRELVRLLEERGLRKRFRTNCAIRIDLIDADLCELLVGLNTEFVYFGLESGSERIQRRLKHYLRSARVTPEQIAPSLALLARWGITTNTTFIVGCPDETEEDLAKTYDFLAEQTAYGHLGEAIANVLTPLPGTTVWDDAVRSGAIVHPFKWRRLRYYAYLGKHHPSHLSVGEWARLRERNESLYLNPGMPKERLYELMDRHETDLERIRGDRRGAPRAPLCGSEGDADTPPPFLKDRAPG